MASDEKRFDVAGVEWIARFDFNAICELEERYDKPFLSLVAPFLAGVDESEAGNPEAQMRAASAIKFSDMRAIFHQSLLDAQPDTTIADAGDVISVIGLDGAMGVVAWAITKAMPTGGEGKENPPKPRKGRNA